MYSKVKRKRTHGFVLQEEGVHGRYEENKLYVLEMGGPLYGAIAIAILLCRV